MDGAMDGNRQDHLRPEAEELAAARAYVARNGGLTTVGATMMAQLLQDGAGTVPASQGEGPHGAEPNTYYEHKEMATRHVISVQSREFAQLLSYEGDEVLKVRIRCVRPQDKNAVLLVGEGKVELNVDEAFDFPLNELQRVGLKAVLDAVPVQEVTLDFDLVAKTVTVSDLTI